jgi:hypothetical protein
MIDLRSRLDEIAGPVVTPSESQVEADVARGRRALRRRRARQAVAGSAFAAVALATAVALGTSGLSPARHPGPPAASDTGHATKLVAYTGEQPEGYTLDKVPDGWEVQGVDAYALVLAPKGIADRDPGSFVGKIAIMLQSQDDHSTPVGTPVRIGDKPGVLVNQDGAGFTLFVKQPSGVYLLIQVWDGLGWGEREIVEFAAGVHVHADAKRGRG